MAKNANGDGSIYERIKDGKVVRYEGAITYEADGGRRRRHTVYGRTREDVRDKLKKARERRDAGPPVREKFNYGRVRTRRRLCLPPTDGDPWCRLHVGIKGDQRP